MTWIRFNAQALGYILPLVTPSVVCIYIRCGNPETESIGSGQCVLYAVVFSVTLIFSPLCDVTIHLKEIEKEKHLGDVFSPQRYGDPKLLYLPVKCDEIFLR